MTDGAVTPGADRDAAGRFAAGNRCAKGNPALRRQHELQQAVRGALTTEQLQDVLRALHSAAIEGDSQAAAVLLQHTVGRPREQAAVVDVDLPPLQTASGIADAHRAIVESVAGGGLGIDDGTKLTVMLRELASATVVAELEQRIARIESERSHDQST